MVQGNLRFDDIGFIVYAPDTPGRDIKPIVGGFVAVIIILLVVGALMYVYFRRRHKRDKKLIAESNDKLLESIRLLKRCELSTILCHLYVFVGL